MSRHLLRSPFRLHNTHPVDPAEAALADWPTANRRFYADFLAWLRDGGYSDAALTVYGRAARLALGWLNKPYHQIDPQADLDQVREHVAARYDRPATRRMYLQGLDKLAEYLCQRCQRPVPEKSVNWEHYLAGLPVWLADDVRRYLAQRRRAWRPEERFRSTNTILSHLTGFLRWAATRAALTDLQDLTPTRWLDYLDQRLTADIRPTTLNVQLSELQGFLRFLAEQGRPVCQRTLRLQPLKTAPRAPKDLPPEQLRRLLRQVQAQADAADPNARRMGLLDRAWVLLMLHSGLRTGEVRHLRLSHLDLEARRVRIEQSKGLKDRVVYLSRATLEALQAYLAVRGVAPSDHVFVYYHRPLGPTYCYARLQAYGRRCGVRATPHQLRHSCATLLLNAGAPILTVQTILGHQHIDTTLGYARLYDGTLAADYYRAMADIERRLALAEGPTTSAPDPAQLLALVDALSAGTLNQTQRQTVQALRAGILTLAEREAGALASAKKDDLPTPLI
jgi:integrase